MIPKVGMFICITTKPTVCTVQIGRVLCPVKGAGWLCRLKEGNFAIVQPSEHEMTAKVFFIPFGTRHEEVIQRVVERIDKQQSPYLTDKESWFLLEDAGEFDYLTFSEDEDNDKE
jgi:hypothetical protein